MHAWFGFTSHEMAVVGYSRWNPKDSRDAEIHFCFSQHQLSTLLETITEGREELEVYKPPLPKICTTNKSLSIVGFGALLLHNTLARFDNHNCPIYELESESFKVGLWLPTDKKVPYRGMISWIDETDDCHFALVDSKQQALTTLRECRPRRFDRSDQRLFSKLVQKAKLPLHCKSPPEVVHGRFAKLIFRAAAYHERLRSTSS